MIQKKRMKKLVACLLSVLLVAVCIPASAFADTMPDFNAGDTIKLENDLTVDETIDIIGSKVIDLNGHTITYTGKSGTYLFNLSRSGIASSVTIKNGKIIAENGRGITTSTGVGITLENIEYVGAERALGIYGGYTKIDKDTVLKTTGYDAAIFVVTKDNYGISGPATLDVSGKVYQTSEKGLYGIAGNGSDKNGITTINIREGAVVEAKGAAGIFHPQNGTLTVDGAVTGTTAIEVRAGNVTIGKTAVVTATAPEYKSVPNASGATSVGAAIAINQHTTKHDINVTINGGTFTGAAALVTDGIQREADNEGPATNVFANIKDGVFNGTVKVAKDGGNIDVLAGTFTDLDRKTVTISGTEAARVMYGEESVDLVGLETINSVLAAMDEAGLADGAKLQIIKASEGAEFIVPSGVTVLNNALGDIDVSVNGETVKPGEFIKVEKPEANPEPSPETKPDADSENPKTSDETRVLSLVVLLVATLSMVLAVKRKNC